MRANPKSPLTGNEPGGMLHELAMRLARRLSAERGPHESKWVEEIREGMAKVKKKRFTG
jgi:hypothetical protein